MTEVTLGFDGSLACSGYAICQGDELLALGKIATSTCKATPTEQDRLLRIYEAVKGLIEEYGVTRIVAEDLHVGKNAKTGLILARVRGIIMLLAAQLKLEFVTYQPSEIKHCVCGDNKGNANKFEVYDAVRALYSGHPLVDTLLPEGGCVDKSNAKKNDDISDALAIAHTDHLYHEAA